MSGLYNMLFGVNPNAEIFLKMAGLDVNEIPRFRDVFVKKGKIVVYTRTGGGNRETYEEANQALAAKPNYVRDFDDPFDSTYAEFEFNPLPEYQDRIGEWESVGEPSIGEKFKIAIENMK